MRYLLALALLAACSGGPDAATPAPRCSDLNGATAFSAQAVKNADGSALVTVTLSGADVIFPSDFSYGSPSDETGGTVGAADRYITVPPDASILAVNAAPDSQAVSYTLPLQCPGGFKDGVTALMVTTHFDRVTMGADGGPDLLGVELAAMR